jgi:hypothetical protein
VVCLRDNLSQYEHIPITLIGRFVRYGKRRDPEKHYAINTVLLSDLCFEDGSFACNHLWFAVRDGFLFTEMKVGALVKISGTVQTYERADKSKDYCISKCANVEILSQGQRLMPSKVWEYDEYIYFKFILNEENRWYRVDKDKKIERLVMTYKNETFEETLVDTTEEDIAFANKHLKFWIVLGANIKFKSFQ